MPKGSSLGQKALVELIGTFMFVFIGAGAVVAAYFVAPTYPSLLVIALANGLALGLAVTFAMSVSGGHLNPAITLAMFATKNIKALDAAIYIIAQLAGAILAGLFLVAFLPAAGTIVHYGTPTLTPAISMRSGIVLEGIMTFFLVLVVFATTIDKRAPKVGGFAIGLTVAVDAMVVGPLTGAAMNPARAIGPAIASLYFANWYIYWIGPILGALAAAIIYDYCILKRR